MPKQPKRSEPQPAASNLIQLVTDSEAPRPTLVEVFQAEESRLLHYAHGFVKRRAVAEELVQDAFLKLHRDWSEVTHPRAWLFRTIRNLALNHLRKAQRETLTDPDTPTANPALSQEALPDLDLGQRETHGLLREVLATLQPDDRELIRLKYQENQSYKQIADTLKIGVGNVGFRLHHLLKDLAARLRQDGLTGSQD